MISMIDDAKYFFHFFIFPNKDFIHFSLKSKLGKKQNLIIID